MNTWIDFKTLRQQLKFVDVLTHFGVEVKKNKGGQHHGFCPIPSHEGNRNSPSFSANLEKGIFNCFGCGAKGNIIDFAALMMGLHPASGTEVRKAALMLQEKFVSNPTSPKQKKKHQAPQLELSQATASKTELSVVVNSPLDFELKNLDPKHSYLNKRGFDQQTIAHFGLGYCAKGLLTGRIAIPIHNSDSKLVGYAGRIVDDSKINDENPRYKFPPKREHKGLLYEFQKTKLLYNAHRIARHVKELVIVEGFASVWWITQMGFPNVVALMGWSCSEEQARIVFELVPTTGQIWLISDGDESGGRCGASVLEHIGSQRFIQWLKLDEGKQPTDYHGVFFREKLGK